MTVVALIEGRTDAARLEKTPIAALYPFGQKLRAATSRKRSGDVVTLWTVERAEAFAAFSYLACFVYPETENFVTTAEFSAVREIVFVLAAGLLARRGPQRMDRSALESRIQTFDLPTSPLADHRWIRRLKQRARRGDSLGATPLNHIPPKLLDLLAPKKIYR